MFPNGRRTRGRNGGVNQGRSRLSPRQSRTGDDEQLSTEGGAQEFQARQERPPNVPSGSMFRRVHTRLQGTSDVGAARNQTTDDRSPPDAFTSSRSTMPDAGNVGMNRINPSGSNTGTRQADITVPRRDGVFAFQPTRSRQVISSGDGNIGEHDQPRDERSEERFVELREALVKANENYNEKKAMLSNALKDIEKLEMNNYALITMFNTLEKERDELRLENQSLRSLNSSAPRRKVSKGKFSSELPVVFHGIASNISRSILGCCDRETKELQVRGEDIRRNWDRRSEKARAEGISIGEGSKIVPTSPFHLADRRQYFTPSFQNEKEMLTMLVDEEISSTTWALHFPTEVHKEECRKAICGDVQLTAQIKQTLSDRMSSRKRNARDKLFQFLGYLLLLSRKSKTGTAHEENERKQQKREIQEKFVVRNGTVYDFSGKTG